MKVIQGVLLVNLGTPDAPTAAAVKRFLTQFLHDKRVVDMTRWLWCPILHGIILPIRSPKVAKLYQEVWTDEGSPLMVYSQRQARLLKERLDMPVELGMTYGNPSLLEGVEALMAQGVNDIIVLPLFPQYSNTTSAAAFDGFHKALNTLPVLPSHHFMASYHQHPLYILALAERVKESWQRNGRGDFLLCSYHGIPQRYADNGDIYPVHCQQTTELLKQALGLTDNEIGMSYQSRFGREEWLKPYTDHELKALAQQGITSIDIMSPAFSADCLETLEELSTECRDLFVEAGGERYCFIPCLNDHPLHIEMMADLVKNRALVR